MSYRSFALVTMLVVTAVLLMIGQERRGTVTGTVFYADIKRPARFAKVTLCPAALIEAHERTSGPTAGALTTISSTADGTFTFDEIPVGAYFILVDQEGYLASTSLYTKDDFEKPSPETRSALALSLPKVLVQAGMTSRLVVEIERGGVIAGTVTYDDGSPAPGLAMSVLKRKSDKSWGTFELSSFGRLRGAVKSDDRGQFRIAGLPEGEYTIAAKLEEAQTTFTNAFGISGASMEDVKVTMLAYLGDTFVRQEAKSIKLRPAEEVGGTDLTVPLSRLHKVAGTVTASRNGHAVDSAKVTVVRKQDSERIAEASLSSEGQFQFEFIPEGEYRLQVTDAMDARKVIVKTSPGSMPPSFVRNEPIRTYQNREVDLDVKGDTTQLVVSVIESKSTQQ